MHIPEQSSHPIRSKVATCIFRSKVDTQIGLKWTLIPEQSGHRFREILSNVVYENLLSIPFGTYFTQPFNNPINEFNPL